ncbi:MAG: carboxypeptidase-like regulatory domain-containing protein [Elusimicrobiota bacterium]|jgi:hypothetical protein
MFRRFYRSLLTGFCGVWWAAAPLAAAENRADLVAHDYAEERVVDLQIVKKVTGQKRILFIKTPRYTEYLEGFVRGMVVDYSDNPVEGVLVRVGDPGEENAMFDPTVTNFNGIYRIRFSIPFDKKNRVNIRNKLVYAPDWEQKRDSLGNSYEPLEKETPFHLSYDRSSKTLSFSEGLRKSFVSPVQHADSGSKKEQPGAKRPKKAEEKKDAGGGDDFFKAFGGGF